ATQRAEINQDASENSAGTSSESGQALLQKGKQLRLIEGPAQLRSIVLQADDRNAHTVGFDQLSGVGNFHRLQLQLLPALRALTGIEMQQHRLQQLLGLLTQMASLSRVKQQII